MESVDQSVDWAFTGGMATGLAAGLFAAVFHRIGTPDVHFEMTGILALLVFAVILWDIYWGTIRENKRRTIHILLLSVTWWALHYALHLLT